MQKHASEEESLIHKVSVLDENTWSSPLPLMYKEKLSKRDMQSFENRIISRERGFSEINAVVTLLRSQLKIENVSSLMLIKMIGPPLILLPW